MILKEPTFYNLGRCSPGDLAMRMVDLIAAKRNGKAHTKEEINFIIDGVMTPHVNSPVKDYQLSAWLMAVCWQGMNLDETAWLTDAMARSGQVLDLSAIGNMIGDKHSTGGVGDKTTLVFVPLLAAAGLPMAKLSGRGLGHTGGTIDKLEAIPGFNSDLPVGKFIQQVKDIGAAIAGQTQELAPADGKLYAMRDVTATVQSIPLIAASVMSKKIAAGANLIILDVKCGRGAFMETQEAALNLAEVMSEVGKRLNRPVTACVTDMEQPLGRAVGHTLEVIEAIEMLKGNGPPGLKDLTFSLGALALARAGLCQGVFEGMKILDDLISSGKALDKMREIIIAQGGDPKVIEDYSLMPTAKLKLDVIVPGTGQKWVEHLDGRLIADACKLMGAGRAKKDDTINLAVGVVLKGKIGTMIEGGQPIATIHADDEASGKKACDIVSKAFKYSDLPVAVPAVIKARVGS